MAVTIPNPAPVMAGERRPVEPQIEFDLAAFHPWRIQPVRHRLSDHPLLQTDALLALSARLEAAGRIRTHANDATAGTPFNDAPQMHPNLRTAVETLNSLREARAWMSLLNVQTDPIYRQLVGSVLDSVQPLVEPRDPGMCHRAGWIFVSSPRTVTPFHFDKEHNFILQIRGHKRVYVWDHRDTTVASELARDRFHQHHDRDQLQWHEEFRGRARVFDLRPGQGAYMPSTSPHMVENGGEPSITISFTYYTNATRRDAMLHKSHAVLRDLGVTPPAVGQWPTLDALTVIGVSNALAIRHLAKRLVGRSGGYSHFAQVGM
jgi:hypothetical protein